LFALAVVVVTSGVSQAGFQFQPETRARLIRMLREEPEACVDLIEQAVSIEELRQALVDRVDTKYQAVKLVEAARALRCVDLPEETTLREILDAADAVATEAGE
jgi:tellurite resistance protein